MRHLRKIRVRIALAVFLAVVFSPFTLALIQAHSKSAKVEPHMGSGSVERPAPPSPTPAPTPLKKEEARKGNQPGPEENVPRWLQTTKAGAEILAYLFALLYFLYRTYVGYFISNLSLQIECKRCPGVSTPDGGATDYLSITSSIKKGDNGLLKLFVAEVRVKSVNGDWEETKPLDIGRVDYDRARVIRLQRNALRWNQQLARKRYLQFPPGDTAQFACWFEVPAGKVYLIDVVIMGRGKWPTIVVSQWRASRVSLPETIEPDAIEGVERA